jgi:hypothetical protein
MISSVYHGQLVHGHNYGQKEQANHQDFFVAIYEYLSEAASE